MSSARDEEASRHEEFEKGQVPPSHQLGSNRFWGMYAGEHAAGTELMIGPLFLLHGVGLLDIIYGLLFGNFLAVLSWRYLCAPIATQARYTLYRHLEFIAGSQLVRFYNLANGVLFCFLAGAMITVSATAIGIPFSMTMPSFSDFYPSTLDYVLVVLGVGLVISLVASFGYEALARFANVAAPWMVLVFLACGIIAFTQLGVSSWSEMQQVWNESILVAQAGEQNASMGFWTVVLFAWFCNAAMHIGMSDLSVFRFAKKPSYGWATSAGMYVGHYMAWIAAALMLAVQIKHTGDTTPLPGPMAERVAGLAGIMLVVVAGWTTANPTIYRAGLAFQAIFPNSSRVTITLVAGSIATFAGLFPAMAFELLGFVGLYGTILAPMGGILFFDWYVVRRSQPEELEKRSYVGACSPAVLMAWFVPVVVALYFIFGHDVTTWYFPLPCWLASGLLYVYLYSFFPSKRVAS